MHIQDPDLYSGELGLNGSAKWPNVEHVFIVNGFVDKSDANFVGSLSFDKIDDTHIFIGPYPQLPEDIQAIAKQGVTGVLNVQTDIDMAHRGVNWSKMVQLYEEAGVRAVNFQIHDFNESDLKEKIEKGAKILDMMIN